MTVGELVSKLLELDQDKVIRIDSYPGWDVSTMVGIGVYEVDGIIYMSELLVE